jgi:hypothetical protein
MNISHSACGGRHGRARLRSAAGRRAVAGAVLVAAVGMAGAAAEPAALAAPASHAASAIGAASALHVASAPAGTISWSVSPASATAPDTRSQFNYANIKPGSTVTDHLAILNHGSQPVAFEVYGTDAIGTTPSNVLILLAPGKRPTNIGSWVRFPQQHQSQMTIIIPGDRGIIEPFTIVVPQQATPGDHVGAIMGQVSFQRKSKAGQVITEYQRIGVPLFLRVYGPLRAGLAVESVAVTFNATINPLKDGSSNVAYTVHNTGNVLLAGNQHVTVSGPLGSATVALKSLPTVLPGDSVRITGRSRASLYPAGPYTATVRVYPAPPPNEPQLARPMAFVSASAGVFATPWGLILLLVILAALIVGVRQLIRLRRRRLRAAIGAVADQVRRDTERRLLGSRPSGTEPQAKA